jgi:hypothetical protein
MKDFVRRIFGSAHSPSSYTQRDKPGTGGPMERKRSPLEGAGRSGWDTEQNRGYGRVHGDAAGPSTFVERGEVRHFRGFGPKNYKRSDRRICEDINDMLTDDRLLDATNIEVEVDDGEVILAGTVEDKAAKRRAEDLAESILGVKHLENRLKILRTT